MEAVVVTLGSLIALLTWSHEQRQRVTNKRFDNIKERITRLESEQKEFPRS